MDGILRIVPRLDVKGPNVVKGVQLEGYRVVGTAEELAELYYREGADELIYQDTVASLYKRPIELDIVRRTAKRAFIPLTVAGGLRTVEDVRQVLRAGADKVAINTAAIAQPKFLKEAAKIFGSQCIVASLEVFRQKNGAWECWTDYGRQQTSIDARAWAQRVVELGAGEIMLTSVNNEGTGNGFDLELIREISTAVPVPVIACGGAGKLEDFVKAHAEGGASAVAAASIFHYHYAGEFDRNSLKERYRLRNGKQDDTGNIDFMLEGYGGIKGLHVAPTSIADVKKALKAAGVRVRKNFQKQVGNG